MNTNRRDDRLEAGVGLANRSIRERSTDEAVPCRAFRTLALGLMGWLLLGASIPLGAAGSDALEEIRSAMRAGDYEEVTQLAKVKLEALEPERGREARYLRALAFFKKEAYAEAIETVDRLLEDGESAWRYKAVFLKARALSELDRFAEVEAIYEAQAKRLLSQERKHELAEVLIRFAEALATEAEESNVGAPPPDFEKAYNLYGRVLEMEIGDSLRDDVMFRRARVIHHAGNTQQAIQDYRTYLAAHDPYWRGGSEKAVSVEDVSGSSGKARGQHVFVAWLNLAEVELEAQQWEQARRHLRDFLGRIETLEEEEVEGRSLAEWDRLGRWQLVRSYKGAPRQEEELNAAIDAVRTFLERHPDAPHAAVAAFFIPEAFRHADRTEEALDGYKAFVQEGGYRLPDGEAASETLEDIGQSPREWLQEKKREALFRIGELQFGQKRYEEAIETWENYTKQYPNGPHWARAQSGIVDAEYRIGLEWVRNEEWKRAKDHLRQFLQEHPLDERSRHILFLFGQIDLHIAEKMNRSSAASDEGDQKSVLSKYREAIEAWRQVISKYPESQEASLALYRIGQIYEEELGDLEKAIASYRDLTWGPYADEAKQRIEAMTQSRLKLRTPRKFGTEEEPFVELNVRNIETVKVRRYRLDLEAYFRKGHEIANIHELDTALIEPEKIWDVAIEGYAKYKPIEQRIEVPFEGEDAGVYLINVSSEEWEATTLVVRSDVDLILKSSRDEALVFVQNRRTGAPASGGGVLLSDGKSILASGETGDDGVYRKKLESLKDQASLRAFVQRDGSIASSQLDLSGLNVGRGLTPKGYVYTDRSAYKPGQRVGIRAVLRDVADGRYVVPDGEAYAIRVMGPNGRMIWDESVSLSDFGTVHAEVPLSEAAGPGTYTIQVQNAADDQAQVFNGEFQVQTFELKKARLGIETPRQVYFRGEKATYRIKAEYYWGEPIVGAKLQYTLPEGRQIETETDKEGVVTAELDTTRRDAPSRLVLQARLPEEGVEARHEVFLSQQGYAVEVEPAQEVALAGEPFEVTVTARGTDGEPVGQALSLEVLQRAAVAPDPVLDAVPWIDLPKPEPAEVRVKEVSIETDAESGKGTAQLTLEEGGDFSIRVKGSDRFGNTITGESEIEISDESDETRLRIFAESSELKVGEEANIRFHSRLEGGLALITFEGESILGHRVVSIEKGMNAIRLDVAHAHFPNFKLAVAVLDGRELHTAAKPFTVGRELQVEIDSPETSFEPGEEVTFGIRTTDQLGRPVPSEVSLAIVNEALYALYPDQAPDIRQFFQEDAERIGFFRVGGSAGFEYEAVTQSVVEAVQEEKERLARLEVEAAKSAMRPMTAPAPAAQPSSVADRESRMRGAVAGQVAPDDAERDVVWENKMLDVREAPRGIGVQGGTAQSLNGARAGGGFGGGGGFAQGRPEPRQDLPAAGIWQPAIRTDASGKAEVTLELPEATSQWRMTAKGVTSDTLVGETKESVVTRKALFVSAKVPHFVREGDRLHVIGRVHNVDNYQGAASLRLDVGYADAGAGAGAGQDPFLSRARSVELSPDKGTMEVVFDGIQIDSTRDLKVTLGIEAGDYGDALTQRVAVHPWGMRYADHAGGLATGDVAAELSLPEERAYRSRRMSIDIGSNLKHEIIRMALDSPVRPLESEEMRSVIYPPDSDLPSDFLATISALEYGQIVGAPQVDQTELTRQARSLLSSLVVRQHDDGGWGWMGSNESDWAVSALVYWGLARCERVGIAVPDKTRSQARQYLETRFTELDANANTAKAALLHGLSLTRDADFARLNRLYRERQQLSAKALAYTALALARTERPDMARELLALLDKQAKEGSGDGGLYWPADRHGSHLDNEMTTTALVLMAYLEVQPGAPQVAQAVDYLMGRRRYGHIYPAHAKGPVVASLAKYFGSGRFAETDFELAISVNGRLVEQRASEKSLSGWRIQVPSEVLQSGINRVEIAMQGRGEFAWSATLEGFSESFKDPKTLDYPYVHERHYWHAPLRYEGRPIGVASRSPVSHIAIGQRVKVEVELSGGNHEGYLRIEEPVPAGFVVDRSSVQSRAVHWELQSDRLVFYYPPNRYVGDIHYDLTGYTTGSFRILPTVVEDLNRPDQMRVGEAATLEVLEPGESSPDPYQLHDRERYALGQAYFNDGRYGEALKYLHPLFGHLQDPSKASGLNESEREEMEREAARMLLWVHTKEAYYDATRIIQAFEVLRERYPDLEIPFDKILVVGRAYRDLGEMERASIVFQAAIRSSFLNDANVSAVLEDQGQYLGSWDYQEDLWREYPNIPEVVSAYFALSQSIYSTAPEAESLQEASGRGVKIPGQSAFAFDDAPTREALLKQTVRLLENFLTYYTDDPMADDAAFSMVNAYLDLDRYGQVVDAAARFRERFTGSSFQSSFQYMKALGYFWQREHTAALEAARVVAEGESEDRDLARYILGQIYHAQGEPAAAIKWYESVSEEFADARESVDYFERQRVALDEVKIVRPGEEVKLDLTYRNVQEASFQVYRVDLMKLYLREKNLANVTQVNLAGISPEIEKSVRLGDGRDFVDKEAGVPLKLEQEGAYLVICRGDDQFASGLLLISPLELQVQEYMESGRVRATVRNAVNERYEAGVHVKAIGSAQQSFQSGETDLRGLFVADGLQGEVTVIARQGDSRYAFYRGDAWVGPRDDGRSGGRQQVQRPEGAPKEFFDSSERYLKNVRRSNQMLQQGNIESWNQQRRVEQKGVKVLNAQ